MWNDYCLKQQSTWVSLARIFISATAVSMPRPAVQAAVNATSTVDTQRPTASIAAPLSGATVSELVPVDVEASDDRGVTRVELRIGNTVVATDDAAPYAFIWDSTSVANGDTEITAYVFDAAGNSTVSSAQVIVDNFVEPLPAPEPEPIGDTEAPTVLITNPQGGSVSGMVTISVDAEDNYGAAGIGLSLIIDDELVAMGAGSTMAYTWNTRPKKVAAGSHVIEAVAVDACG